MAPIVHIMETERLQCDSNLTELSNLQRDIAETNNRAKHFSEKVKHLNQLLDDYLAKTNAIIPQPNPTYRK